MSEEKVGPDPKMIGGIIGAMVLSLGSGMGGGYMLRGSEAHAGTRRAEVAPERVESLERWRAAQEALTDRDRAERAELTSAIRDAASTNAVLRETLVSLNERFGAMDSRVRALETRSR